MRNERLSKEQREQALLEQELELEANAPAPVYGHGPDGRPLDAWLPASGGTEEPFTARSGRRLLYCFNPAEGRHAYVDLGTDLVLSDEEAQQALDLF